MLNVDYVFIVGLGLFSIGETIYPAEYGYSSYKEGEKAIIEEIRILENDITLVFHRSKKGYDTSSFTIKNCTWVYD